MPLKSYLPEIAIPALVRQQGRALLEGVGEQLDQLAQRARDTAQAALLDLCGDDALGSHGANSKLPKARVETLTQYRTVLQRRWISHARGGVWDEMIYQIHRLGYPAVDVVTYRDLRAAGLPPSTFGGYSSFWYLRIRQPHPWDPAGKWGPVPVGSGAIWGAAPFTWGSSARVAEIAELRRTIAEWKPAGSSCRFIDVWLRVDLFGNPIDSVRWPIHESWEYGTNGGAPGFYNYSYEVQ